MSSSRFRTHLIVRSCRRSRRRTQNIGVAAGVGAGQYQLLKPSYMNGRLRRHLRGLWLGTFGAAAHRTAR